MLSEINSLHFSIVFEFLRSAGPEDRSIVDDIGAVSDLQGFSDVVVGDEHSDHLGFQMFNDLLNFEYRDRIDSGERLIQQDELRRNYQRTRNFDSPSFAS